MYELMNDTPCIEINAICLPGLSLVYESLHLQLPLLNGDKLLQESRRILCTANLSLVVDDKVRHARDAQGKSLLHLTVDLGAALALLQPLPRLLGVKAALLSSGDQHIPGGNVAAALKVRAHNLLYDAALQAVLAAGLLPCLGELDDAVRVARVADAAVKGEVYAVLDADLAQARLYGADAVGAEFLRGALWPWDALGGRRGVEVVW